MESNSFFHGINPGSANWRNPNPPSPPVPDWFVKALTDIGGLNDAGKPVLRIVWPGNHLHFRDGRMRIKYPRIRSKICIGFEFIDPEDPDGKDKMFAQSIDSVPKGTPFREIRDWSDEAVRHFVIEEWLRPSSIGWNSEARYTWTGTGERIDHLGDLPEEGYYDYLWGMQTDEGEPISPSDFALQELRRFKQFRDNDPILKTFGPNEYPPPDVIEGLVRQAEYEAAEQDEKAIKKNAEAMEEELMSHINEFYAALNESAKINYPKLARK